MASYVFNKKVDSILIAAGGKKEEHVSWRRTQKWVEYDSEYLREFCGDGYYTEGPIEEIHDNFFAFLNGGIIVKRIGSGQAKIVSIVGDEIEVSTDELKSDIADLIDLFDTPELRKAIKAKELEEAAKAEEERRKEEEQEMERQQRQKKEEEVSPLAEQAFQLLYDGKKITYNARADGREVSVHWGWNKGQRKKTISLSKYSSFYGSESISFDIKEVVELDEVRKGFSSIDSTEWFPEGLEDLKGFYEYIIAH